MAQETLAYKCDHCSRLLKSKAGATRHEKACNKNPINQRACFGCSFLEMVDFEHYYDTGWTNGFEIRSHFKCSLLNKGVYPPKAERNGNQYELVEITNEPMPIDCEHRATDSILAILEKSTRPD